MPEAKLTVLSTNDLILNFNDTLTQEAINSTDLNIRIFGTELSYHFTWNAKYVDSKTVQVDTEIITKLYGTEQIVLEFLNTNKFKSVFSKRGVNPSDLSGKLFENQGSTGGSDSLSQTAMIIFFSSVGIAVISSFGGNSMEMMWNLMNTLQLLYFLSYVYVKFPEVVTQFFSFLKYANAKNEYLNAFTFLIISDSKFKRGTVSKVRTIIRYR